MKWHRRLLCTSLIHQHPSLILPLIMVLLAIVIVSLLALRLIVNPFLLLVRHYLPEEQIYHQTLVLVEMKRPVPE